MEIGKKTWVFADGDLPPHGKKEPLGHEALMIVNNCDEDAEINVDILFEDREPKLGVKICVGAKRVFCFRMDKPLGKDEYKIPFGQYALVLNSKVPIVAAFGRLDRRKNMAYYSQSGFSC